MTPPPPPKPLCKICNEPCNVQVSAFCVKCKKIYVGCLGISSTSNSDGMIIWSCAGCTPTAKLSALDRNSALEKKLDCVEFLIREATVLCNEIAFIMRPDLSFLKTAKIGPARNRNDSSSIYQSATVHNKKKADEFELKTV